MIPSVAARAVKHDVDSFWQLVQYDEQIVWSANDVGMYGKGYGAFGTVDPPPATEVQRVLLVMATQLVPHAYPIGQHPPPSEIAQLYHLEAQISLPAVQYPADAQNWPARQHMLPQGVSPREYWHPNVLQVVVTVSRPVVVKVKYSVVVIIVGIVSVQVEMLVAT